MGFKGWSVSPRCPRTSSAAGSKSRASRVLRPPRHLVDAHNDPAKVRREVQAAHHRPLAERRPQPGPGGPPCVTPGGIQFLTGGWDWPGPRTGTRRGASSTSRPPSAIHFNLSANLISQRHLQLSEGRKGMVPFDIQHQDSNGTSMALKLQLPNSLIYWRLVCLDNQATESRRSLIIKTPPRDEEVPFRRGPLLDEQSQHG